MQKPGIVVQGIPLEANRDEVHEYFEKHLAGADQTLDFEVAYPINNNYCQGVENVAAGASVAVILFRDNEHGIAAADYLCKKTLVEVQVSRLQPQVFRELTAPVRTDFLKLFPRSKDLNRILGKVQGRTCVGLKHQEDGPILLTGHFFQIATAQELLDVEIKGRASSLEQKKQKRSVSNDEEEPNNIPKSHLSVNGVNTSSVADTQASAVSQSTTPSGSDPKEVKNPRHPKQVRPHMEQGLNAVTDRETEVDTQNDDLASTQNQTHDDEAGDVGTYFLDPEPKRSTQQQQLKQPRVESEGSGPSSLRDESGVPDEPEPSTFETRSKPPKQVEDNLPDGKGKRAEGKNEQRQAEQYRGPKEEPQERKQHRATRKDNYENQEHVQHKEEENGSYGKQKRERHEAEDAKGTYSTQFSRDGTMVGSAVGSSSSYSSLPSKGSHETPSSIVTSKGDGQSHRVPRHPTYHSNQLETNSSAVAPNPYGHAFDKKTLSAANIYKSRNGDQFVLVYKRNIVEVRVDAIVNSSNTALVNEAGVSRVIAAAAGSIVEKECKKIKRQYTLKETDVVHTPGGSLCKHILHAIGPNGPYSYSSRHPSLNNTSKRILETTFGNCLRLAEKLNATSIVIPAIGSGSSQFPESFVANALHSAVVEFCFATRSSGSLKEIHLVDIDDKQTRETNGCFKQSQDFEKFTASPLVSGVGAATAGHMTTSDNVGNGARLKTSSSSKEEDNCVICLESLQNRKIKSLKCGHVFCEKCIDQALAFKKVCPTCGSICGKLTGNQPKDGTMTHTNYKYQSLAGYEGCGMIVIDYFFRSGIQGAEHPNPGKRYDGTQRTAYLPDNEEGNEVLHLLQQAFAARLIFTIGESVTTGRTDQVTWNDIHHKTEKRGGSFGYPDSTYLRRVKEELAAKGIK